MYHTTIILLISFGQSVILNQNLSHEQLNFPQKEKDRKNGMTDFMTTVSLSMFHLYYMYLKESPWNSVKTWYIGDLSGIWKMKLFIRFIRMQSNFKKDDFTLSVLLTWIKRSHRNSNWTWCQDVLAWIGAISEALIAI